MFLLDTNTIIFVLNERRPLLSARLDREMERGTIIFLSSIVLYELRVGIAKSQRRDHSEQVLQRLLRLPFKNAPFDTEDAQHAGDIRAALERAGTPIGPYDVLIAAQARRIGAVLVTDNQREFSRVPGLAVSDWLD
jgi:tRNA(fMet)-specific endonuclease VapC